MQPKNDTPLLWIIMFFELAVIPALADAPYEQYHVIYDDIASGVLENTIGILTINSGVKNGKELRTYSQAGETFVFHRTLQAKAEMRPISHFGYGDFVMLAAEEYARLFGHDEYQRLHAHAGSGPKIGELAGDSARIWISALSNAQIRKLGSKRYADLVKRSQLTDPSIENYRFPVVERRGHFVCLVYDPVENLRTWIDLQELAGSFYYDLAMIDSLAVKQNSYNFVDIFHFTSNGKRKLYQQPQPDARFTIISKDDRRFRLLKVIAQKDGFFQVGIVSWVNKEETKINPFGCIRIRDYEKRLMLWMVAVDNC
jgi:hypothetical protein